MSGRHHSINLNFMITGHTKFAPDGSFGLIKKAYRRTAVSSLDELCEVVASRLVLLKLQNSAFTLKVNLMIITTVLYLLL